MQAGIWTNISTQSTLWHRATVPTYSKPTLNGTCRYWTAWWRHLLPAHHLPTSSTLHRVLSSGHRRLLTSRANLCHGRYLGARHSSGVHLLVSAANYATGRAAAHTRAAMLFDISTSIQLCPNAAHRTNRRKEHMRGNGGTIALKRSLRNVAASSRHTAYPTTYSWHSLCGWR